MKSLNNNHSIAYGKTMELFEIQSAFVGFLDRRDAIMEFESYLFSNRGIRLLNYISTQYNEPFGREIRMKFLIYDAFPFMTTASGTNYWNVLDNDWRIYYGMLISSHNKVSTSCDSEKQTAFNSIW